VENCAAGAGAGSKVLLAGNGAQNAGAL